MSDYKAKQKEFRDRAKATTTLYIPDGQGPARALPKPFRVGKKRRDFLRDQDIYGSRNA